MNTLGELILIHVVIGLMVAFFIASLRSRRLNDLTYDARMELPFLRRFLMPGKLADREVWVRQQRILSWFGLVFSGVVYLLAIFKILS
jgi:hypothetical protein